MDEYEDLVQELATVRDQIGALCDREEEIKGKLRANLPVGLHVFGQWMLTVSAAPRKFDDKYAANLVEQMDIGKQRQIWQVETVKKVNRQLLQALAPETYEHCLRHYEPRITLRRMEDAPPVGPVNSL